MPSQDSRNSLTQYNNLYKEADGVYHLLARHYKLSDCAFWILYTLRESEHTAYTQKDICSLLHLSKQTINSALKKLESENIIRLEPMPDDQRNKQLFLTDKGREFTGQTVDNILLMDQNAFDCFSAEERALFLQLMQKYVHQLRNEAEKILNSSADNCM